MDLERSFEQNFEDECQCHLSSLVIYDVIRENSMKFVIPNTITIDLLWVACWINVKSYNVVYVVSIIMNMVFTCGIYMCNCFVSSNFVEQDFLLFPFLLLHPSSHQYTSMKYKTIPNTKLKLEESYMSSQRHKNCDQGPIIFMYLRKSLFVYFLKCWK